MWRRLLPIFLILSVGLSFGQFATTTLDPVSQSIEAGWSANVDIDWSIAFNADPTIGIEAWLNFDPALLEVVSVTGSGTPFTSTDINTFDNTAGTIHFKATGGSVTSGDYTMATIVFQGIAAGTSQITFSNVDQIFQSTGAYGVNGQATGGSIEVTGAIVDPPAAVVFVDPTPADGGTGAPLGALIIWELSDGATGYLVNVGTDNPPTNLIQLDLIGDHTFFQNPSLTSDYSTTYYYSVTPYNSAGNPSVTVRSFTTLDDPSGSVLINEFDTNTSSAEYIELFNTSSSDVDLGAANYSLVFYNGNGTAEYQTTDLTGVIPANGFFVLAESGVTDIGGYTPDQNASWTSFQNGTDAVQLVLGSDQEDAIIYGSTADTPLETLLGLPGILIVNESIGSSSRVTDGQGGAAYANSDWHTTLTRTPGATNVAPPPSYTPYTILEIQTPDEGGDASQHVGELVETTGIITAMTSYSFYMQDGTADYSGIYVYVNGDVSAYALGDEVTIQGAVEEYFGLTQLGSIADVTINSSGNAVPEPILLITNTLAEGHEGMLVKIGGECTAVSTDPGSDRWAFKIDDGSGDALVDDQVFSAAEDAAVLGSNYDVVGAVNYYFGAFTVNPRDAADVVEIITVVGESCEDPFVYGAVNDASMAGDLVAEGADWYSFTTDGTFGEITLSTSASTGLSDSRIAVFADCADFTGTLGSNPAGNIGYDDDGGTGFLSELTLAGLEAGTYYVVVYGYGATDAGLYDLAITGVADPCDAFVDSYEPNDVMGDATLAIDGDVFNAALCPTDDSDWFAVEGLALGVITAETTPLSLGEFDTDTYMYLYDAAGNMIDSDDDGGAGYTSMISYELPADGTYYFEVVVSSWAAGDVFDYTMNITVDDPPGPVPQNLMAMAGDAMIDLTWEPVPMIPLSLRETDSVLPLKISNPKDNLSSEKQLMHDTFVRKQSEQFALMAADATREAGDTCGEAIDYGPINGASIGGDLVAEGADWYSFTTDGTFGEITLSTSASTGLSDSRIAVFADCADFTGTLGSNPAGNIGYDDDGGTGFLSELTLAGLEAGTYYVVVYGYGATDAGLYDLAITGVADPCDAFVDSYEPNDVMGDATLAIDGDVFNAALCPTDDSDWFAVEGLALGVITAETTPLSLGEFDTDTYMYLYDAAGNMIDSDDDGGAGYTSMISYELPADGTYYFEVVVSSWAAGDVFDYTMNITVDDPPSYIPTWSVYRDGAFLVGDLMMPHYMDDGLVNGTTYCYTVTQDMEDLSESGHSDEACATPEAAAPGEVCETAIDYGMVNDLPIAGDLAAEAHDWYSFYTDGTYQQVTASLCGGSGLGDSKLAVFAACEDFVEWPAFGAPEGAIGYNDDACGLLSEVNLDGLEAGTYYVAVYGYSASQSGTYELAVTGVMDPCENLVDMYEPNDLMETATVAMDGDVFDAALCPTDDSDFFVISALALGTFTAEITPLSSDEYATDTYLNLYDSEGVLLDSDDDGGIGFTSMIMHTPQYDGDYYVEVVVSSWAAGDVFDYTLNITVEDPPLPIPQNLMAMAGFGFIDLTWDPVPTVETLARTNAGVSPLKTSNPKDELHPNKAALQQIFAAKQAEMYALMAGDALREPGDTCAEAIDYGAVNAAPITADLIAGDHEWYSFTTDGSYGEVTVSLCGSVGIGDSKLAVFASCDDFIEWPGFGAPEGAIGYNDDACGLLSEVDLAGLEAGTYYVAVYGYGATDAGSYELAVTGVADPCEALVDTYEPNDGIGEATVALDGDMFNAALCPTVDSDFYAISGLELGTITVETMPLSFGEFETDTYLNLYDEAGNLLDSDDDGGVGYTSMITYTLPHDGTFYFEVVVSSWAAGDVFDYAMSVTVDDPPAYIATFNIWRDGALIAENVEPIDLEFHGAYTDAGLDFGTYCYEVTQNMADMTVSGASEPACASITPMPPMNLMGSASDAQVDLMWQAPLVIETGWLSYHDGTFENSLASTDGGAGIATLFQPLLYPVVVEQVQFHISGDGWDMPMEVYILADDGATVIDGPYAVNGVDNDWVVIDNVDFTLESGGFLVATYNVGPGGPYVSVDQDHYPGNVYFGSHTGGFSELGGLGFFAAASHEAYVNYDGNTVMLTSASAGTDLPATLGTPAKDQSLARSNSNQVVVHSNKSSFVNNESSSATRELVGYNVYRGVDPESLELLAQPGETFFTDMTVENGVTYFYMVTAAYDAEGESLPTNMVALTPLGAAAIPYFSDLEADGGGFSADMDWEWGAPTFVDGPAAAYSGANVWGTTLNDDYPNNSNSWLIQPFDLSSANGSAELSYAVWTDLETNWDYAYVAVDHDNDGNYEVLAEYNGFTDGWWMETLMIPASHLTEYAKIAFIFQSDGSVQYPGIYVDDISVIATPTGMVSGMVTSTYDEGAIEEVAIVAVETTSMNEFVAFTGPDGYYEMYLPVGSYEVAFIHEDYHIPELSQVDVLLDDAIVLDQVLAPNLVAPENLMATEVEGGVHLTWDMPSGTLGEFEGFEGGEIPPDWQALDIDQDGFNWFVGSGFSYSGDFAVTSESYNNNVGPLSPNNYLITPEFEIGPGTTLSFWVGATDPAWYWEHFQLMLSTSGSTPDDFTIELLDYELTTDAWTEIVVDLSAYAGFMGYIAWVHSDVTDVYNFSIDDISLVNGDGMALLSYDFESPEDIEQFQIYPIKTTDEMTEEEIQVRLAENEAYHAENSLRSEFLFYQVYSSVDGGAWNLTGAAMTTEYVDDSAAAGQTIEYYVTALYDIGESDMSNTVQLDVVSVDEIGIPNTFALHQNYPNPFNPITSIRYDLPEAAHVRIAVYNVLGQKVATLVDQSMNAGFHDISWSGTNDLGSTVSSGVYLYRIESENFNAVRKLMYLK